MEAREIIDCNQHPSANVCNCVPDGIRGSSRETVCMKGRFTRLQYPVISSAGVDALSDSRISQRFNLFRPRPYRNSTRCMTHAKQQYVPLLKNFNWT